MFLIQTYDSFCAVVQIIPTADPLFLFHTTHLTESTLEASEVFELNVVVKANLLLLQRTLLQVSHHSHSSNI